MVSSKAPTSIYSYRVAGAAAWALRFLLSEEAPACHKEVMQGQSERKRENVVGQVTSFSPLSPECAGSNSSDLAFAHVIFVRPSDSPSAFPCCIRSGFVISGKPTAFDLAELIVYDARDQALMHCDHGRCMDLSQEVDVQVLRCDDQRRLAIEAASRIGSTTQAECTKGSSRLVPEG